MRKFAVSLGMSARVPGRFGNLTFAGKIYYISIIKHKGGSAMESDKTYSQQTDTAREPEKTLSPADILRDTDRLLEEFAEDYRRMAE